EEDPEVDLNLLENKKVIMELQNQIQHLEYKNPMNINNFFDVPKERIVSDILTDKDIVTIVQENINEEEQEDDSIELENISPRNVLEILGVIETF
ncbi:25_t:CDS:1, partial [Acaulospora morrowiae]